MSVVVLGSLLGLLSFVVLHDFALLVYWLDIWILSHSLHVAGFLT
jgi:hypothetical protein